LQAGSVEVIATVLETPVMLRGEDSFWVHEMHERPHICLDPTTSQNLDLDEVDSTTSYDPLFLTRFAIVQSTMTPIRPSSSLLEVNARVDQLPNTSKEG
jgi:hypothetical protein